MLDDDEVMLGRTQNRICKSDLLTRPSNQFGRT